MRVAVVAVLAMFMTVVAPSRAQAFFGLDFMEWLNDMSGPGPFHVFGAEATLACWGHLAERQTKTIRQQLAARNPDARRELELELAKRDRTADDSPAAGPAAEREAADRRLADYLTTLGFNPDERYVGFSEFGDLIVTPKPGLRRLRSLALTGHLAFACNQPLDPSSELLVDMHRSQVLLGVLVNYLFTPMNHLQYDGRTSSDTPNVHGVLALATADVEFKRFLSLGVGTGAMVFKGGKVFRTFTEPAVQFRLGLRPLKHLDVGSPAKRPNGVPETLTPFEGLTFARDVEDAPLQSLLKTLSTLRFVIGYTWLPTSSRLTAEHFGARAGSWAANHDEHILTVNFSWDLSRARKWREHRVAATGTAGDREMVPLGERARY